MAAGHDGIPGCSRARLGVGLGCLLAGLAGCAPAHSPGGDPGTTSADTGADVGIDPTRDAAALDAHPAADLTPVRDLPPSPDLPWSGDLGHLPDAGRLPEDLGEPAEDATLDGGAPDSGTTLPAPTRADALALLRASVLPLPCWRFATDPRDDGLAAGWAGPDQDDGEWAELDAGRTWEDQGFAGYDGVGWYRTWVELPAGWAGSPIRLEASGVDDEYDVFVNGRWLHHHGERPDRSVWGWRTLTRVDGALIPGQRNLIALRVVDWGGGGGLWRAIELRRAAPLEPFRVLLPEPILDAAPERVTLYWEAWRLAWEKVRFGTPANGFVDAYLDEGFNEQIYQWDTSFIVLFARHGRELFPVMETLDNFYRRQRADGYIQRVYSETDGGPVGEPTEAEPLVNPPLFAWVEWEYVRLTGDPSRLARVFPILERYHGWLREHLRHPTGRGLYYQTGLGSGMDNSPRGPIGYSAWIDMSSQMALAARCLAAMAGELGLPERQVAWSREFDELAAAINQLLWSEADGIYYDLEENQGGHNHVRHIGAFWPLLAGLASPEQAARLVAHLEDPAEFNRPHRVPTLAASDPNYVASGHYWRGGVWAPTNAMVVLGLRRYGHVALARTIAENHLDQLVQVYFAPPADPARIAPEERDGEYATLWECYSPEQAAPGTRWDGTYFCRQDFVGWTGLGPIGMLIEEVLGFQADGRTRTLRWELNRTDRHGIRRLLLGTTNHVSLIAARRDGVAEPIRLQVDAAEPFTLELAPPGRAPRRYELPAGHTELVAE